MTTKGLLSSLSEQEYLLIAETERAVLAELDEDDLVELHARVRRARTKYVKQYRRGASARIAATGAMAQRGRRTGARPTRPSCSRRRSAE